MKKAKCSISKNLILSFVLLVTIIFAVLAWFHYTSRSRAEGISVASITAKGLEVAFEDVDDKYSDTLIDDNKKYYPLISGNGSSFLIPDLNRSTGEALTPYSSKRDAVANKDYYETDLYFRSDEELNVKLTLGSKIVPNDFRNDSHIDNKSTFGDFTKDYIAGAARVAFFNVDANGNETFKSLWIPNSSYELIESSNYSKIKKDYTGGSGIDPDPNVTFGLYNTSLYEKSSYYLWEGHANTNTSTLLSAPTNKVMYKSKTDGLYYGAVDVEANMTVDHFINITQSTVFNYNNTSISSTKSNSQRDLSNYLFENNTYWIGSYIDGKYNITYNNGSVQWAKLVVDANPNKSTFFNSIDRFQILLSYNPSNDMVVIKEFVFYNKTTGAVGGGTGNFGTGSASYELNDNSIVLIGGVYTDLVYGLTFTNNNLKSTVIYDNLDTIQNNNSNTMFVVDKIDSGSYTFKHLPSNKYLSYNENNEIVLSNTASEFTLSVGDNGPLLGINGRYIDFQGGYFFTSTDESASIMLYEGNLYSFLEDGETEESYQYIVAGNSTPNKLPSTAYFTDISKAPTMATLSKMDNSGYYKAHMRIRIWAEGTDREAKIPLAGGIFDNILMFEGHRMNE